MSFRGRIDICQQSHVAGWAADSRGNPVPVTVLINGKELMEEIPRVLRVDLPRHGISDRSGFTFTFATPLGLSDRVEILFPDGSHLNGSPCTSHQPRLRQLLDGIGPEMRGLEFGPLDRPILSKHGYCVLYVDHASRQDLIAKYETTGTVETVNPKRIVEVDIIWDGTKPLTASVPANTRFDYCLASHVIEHVANPVGWLLEISSVLAERGVISLAVPDKERTFDHLRAVSRPADIIDSYVRQLTRPSPLHVFDHITTVSPIGKEPQPASPAVLREALQHALAVHATDRYMDVHCHVFTQRSFLDVFATVANTGILPLELRRFFPTEAGANEFIVSLQKSTARPEDIARTFASAVQFTSG